MQTKREELEQQIDETPQEIMLMFTKELHDQITDISELVDVFSVMPFLHFLSKERVEIVVKTIVENVMEVFKEELVKEISAFCEYWKSVIPPEEDLVNLTEGEIEEKVLTPFERELDDLFEAFMKKTYAAWMGETS